MLVEISERAALDSKFNRVLPWLVWLFVIGSERFRKLRRTHNRWYVYEKSWTREGKEGTNLVLVIFSLNEWWLIRFLRWRLRPGIELEKTGPVLLRRAELWVAYNWRFREDKKLGADDDLSSRQAQSWWYFELNCSRAEMLLRPLSKVQGLSTRCVWHWLGSDTGVNMEDKIWVPVVEGVYCRENRLRHDLLPIV